MVILKKVKSSSLLESIIATVLIVVIFMVSSLVINNIYFNTFHQKKEIVEKRLNELEYYLLNDKLELPFEEEIENWNIEVTAIQDEKLQKIIQLKGTNIITNKEVTRKIILNEN